MYFIKISTQVHCSDADRDALNADMTKLTLEDFSSNCGICSLKFLTKNSVVYHQKIEHRVGVERTAECNKCHKVMKPFSLRSHMKTHQERNDVCHLCYAKLSNKANLKQHLNNKHVNDAEYLDRTISDEELIWPCNQCELRFVAKKFLDDHSRVHKPLINQMKGKSQSCKLCYKTFSDTRAATKHEKVRHVKEAEYLQRDILDSELVHICTGCDKRFVTENILKLHNKKHELESMTKARKNTIASFVTESLKLLQIL